MSAATATATLDAAARLNPRALVLWSLSALTIALVTSNPVYRGLVALAALAVVQTWCLPGRRLRPLVLMAIVAAAIAALLNVLASHSGAHELVRLPDALPIVGGPVTVESLAYGGAIGLGLVAALLAVAPLSLALEPHDVVGAMPAPIERTGVAVAASMNLVSGIGRTFAAVREAQRMRGWRPRGLRSWNEVLVPVVLTAIEDSVQLAEAMEARGYGSGPRTSFGRSSWSARDVAVAVVAVAAAAAFVALKLLGVAADWYPYPALAAPSLDPRLVLGCVALALPALLRR